MVRKCKFFGIITSEEFYNVASEILKRIYSIENTQRFFYILLEKIVAKQWNTWSPSCIVLLQDL